MLIQHPIQVRILVDEVRLAFHDLDRTLALDLPGLTPAENLAFQERLNPLLAERGWRAAGFFGLLALAVTIVFFGVGFGPAPTVLAAGTASVGLGALFGKFLGAAYSRLRLKSTLKELYDRVAPRRPGRESRMPLILVAE